MAAAQSLEENKELVTRFIDAIWNGNDLDAIDDLASPDLVVHALGAGIERTLEEFAEFHGGLLAAVPDLEHTVEEIVAEKEQVVAYVTIRGTPERQYGALAPTGESFHSVGFQKYRINNGRITEVVVLPNAMGMLRQLGIFPDSPGKVFRLMVGAMKARIVRR